MAYAKGSGPVSANFAKGGKIFTTSSRFLKTPDVFREGVKRQHDDKKGKGGTLSKTEGETKKLATVKPHT